MLRFEQPYQQGHQQKRESLAVSPFFLRSFLPSCFNFPFLSSLVPSTCVIHSFLPTSVSFLDLHITHFRDEEISQEDCLFLCDNLSSQTSGKFSDLLRVECRSTLKLGPPNATHLWQPVDQHIGRLYQRLMARSYDEWMASPDAAKYFEVGGGKLSAARRRILLTHWA